MCSKVGPNIIHEFPHFDLAQGCILVWGMRNVVHLLGGTTSMVYKKCYKVLPHTCTAVRVDTCMCESAIHNSSFHAMRAQIYMCILRHSSCGRRIKQGKTLGKHM